MNADPTDTRYPHLDLGDLIAGAAGQPIGDRAREHLARCEHCQPRRTGGTSLPTGSAAWPPPRRRRPSLPGRGAPGSVYWRAPGGAPCSWPAARQPRSSCSRGVGAATGYVHVHLPAHGTGTALTAVSGCAGLELANGTLEQVNGSSLVIKTASGQPVTVTTTASTRVSVAGALLSDITDGASVIVLGPSSGGTIAAASVTVGPPPGGTAGKAP